MEEIILYRKRLIPYENIRLDRDVVLYADSEKIITKWTCIRPRKDMDHGYSLYLLNQGLKISKFCKSDNSLLKWYCDIVDCSFSTDSKSLTALDLLLDITVSPSGEVRVLDMDELAMAHKEKLISDDLLEVSLMRANTLLKSIYSGEFDKFTSVLDKYANQ